jgi:hypothetical protein
MEEYLADHAGESVQRIEDKCCSLPYGSMHGGASAPTERRTSHSLASCR